MTKQNELDLKDYNLLKETIDNFLEDHPKLLKRDELEDIYCNLLRACDTFSEASETYSELYDELENACLSIGLEGEPEDYPELEDSYIYEDYHEDPEEFMAEFQKAIEEDIDSFSNLLNCSNKRFIDLPKVIKESNWGKRQIIDFTYNKKILTEIETFLKHLTEQMKIDEVL